MPAGEPPKKSLAELMKDLNDLVGLVPVKAEISKQISEKVYFHEHIRL